MRVYKDSYGSIRIFYSNHSIEISVYRLSKQKQNKKAMLVTRRKKANKYEPHKKRLKIYDLKYCIISHAHIYICMYVQVSYVSVYKRCKLAGIVCTYTLSKIVFISKSICTHI